MSKAMPAQFPEAAIGLLHTAITMWIEQLNALDDATFEARFKEWTDESRLDAAGAWSEALVTLMPGKTATAFNAVAKAFAALSFMPGGVEVFNHQFESTRPCREETTA